MNDLLGSITLQLSKDVPQWLKERAVLTRKLGAALNLFVMAQQQGIDIPTKLIEPLERIMWERARGKQQKRSPSRSVPAQPSLEDFT